MYTKKFKKKYQEKWENAYLIVKNARASRPQPIFYGSLCSPDFAALHRQNLRKNFWGPPLTKFWIRYCCPIRWNTKQQHKHHHLTFNLIFNSKASEICTFFQRHLRLNLNASRLRSQTYDLSLFKTGICFCDIENAKNFSIALTTWLI